MCAYHCAQLSYTTERRTILISPKIQDAKKSPKSPSGHHRTILSGYVFAIKARIDNRKKTC